MSVEFAKEANFTFGAETHRIADLHYYGNGMLPQSMATL